MLRDMIYNMSVDYTLFLSSAYDLPYEVSGSSPTIFLQKSKIKKTTIIGIETLSESDRINKLNLPSICTI
jgi:hypothetical protein